MKPTTQEIIETLQDAADAMRAMILALRLNPTDNMTLQGTEEMIERLTR